MKSVQSVQEELKSVLDIFNKREKHLEILKTPEVYITASSSPREVQKWLKEKQFSKRLPFFPVVPSLGCAQVWFG